MPRCRQQKKHKQMSKTRMNNPSPHVNEEADDASDVDSMDSDAPAPENEDLEFGMEDEIDKEE